MPKHTMMLWKSLDRNSRPLCLYLSVLHAVAILAAEPLGTCYYPGGKVAPNHFPCDQAYITQCCPMGWTCFSNNVCAVTDPRAASSSQPIGTSARAPCTNPKWNNDICGDFCLGRYQSPIRRKLWLMVYPGDSDIDGKLVPCGNDTFCCAGDQASGACDCVKGTGTTSIASGRVQTVIGLIGVQGTQTSAFSTAIATQSAGPANTISQSKPEPTSNHSRTGASSSSLHLQSKTPTTKTNGFKAAIGVACAIVGLGILFILWRLLRKHWRSDDGGAASRNFGYTETANLTPPNGDPYVNMHSTADVQDPPIDPSRSGQLLSVPSRNPYEVGAPSNLNMSHLNSSIESATPPPTNTLGERPFGRTRHVPLASLPFPSNPYERETTSELPMADDRY
jgi:hypothetical protein